MELRVGTTGDYSPFSVAGDEGYAGLDISLIQELAQRSGMSVRFEKIGWKDVEKALSSGKVDVVACGITITEARRTGGVFTRPYLRNTTVVLAASRGTVPQGNIEDVVKGKRLGVNRGGYLETVARGRLKSATVVTVTDNAKLPEKLVSGDFDFCMSDALEARKFMTRHKVRVIAELEPQEHALYFWKGDEGLVSEIDENLGKMLVDGTVARLAREHGVDEKLVPKG